MNNSPYPGCTIIVTSSESPWNWYHKLVGSKFVVIEVRDQYDDVIVENGNCIDFGDFVMIE